MCAGNLASILSSLFICSAISLWKPQVGGVGEDGRRGGGCASDTVVETHTCAAWGSRAVSTSPTHHHAADSRSCHACAHPANQHNHTHLFDAQNYDWQTTREIPTVDEDLSAHAPMTGDDSPEAMDRAYKIMLYVGWGLSITLVRGG